MAFLLLFSFVPPGMYGTPQIKLPTKVRYKHTLGLQTRAQNLNKNYCMPTEDVKLLRRNLRARLQEVTSSFRLFKLARSALQIMKICKSLLLMSQSNKDFTMASSWQTWGIWHLLVDENRPTPDPTPTLLWAGILIALLQSFWHHFLNFMLDVIPC